MSELLSADCTAKTIEQAIEAAELVTENGNRRVYSTGDAIVKIGPSARILSEEYALRYVAENTQILVPKVFACVELRLGQHALVMEKLKGANLVENAESLDWPQYRTSISLQVASFIRQLRQIRRKGHFGGLESNAYDGPAFVPLPEKPFSSVREFHRYWTRTRTRARPREIHTLGIEEILEVDDDEESVLSHGNLHARNIMIEDGEVTGITGWEGCGFYPKFWESARMMFDFRAPEEWQKIIPRITNMHYREYIAYRGLMANASLYT